MNTQQSTNAHLTCERCHGIGYDKTATGKVAPGDCLFPGRIYSLGVKLEVVNLKANRVPAKRRKLGFAIVQGIEQHAGLELVGSFGIGKAVDETLDSHFFRGKSNRRHDRPPRRQMGLGSLAVPAADSSCFRRQESSEVVSNHQEMSGEQG